MTSRIKIVLTASLLACSASGVLAHEDDAKGPGGETLGSVTFPNSCAKGVQKKFTRGVALLHSFWYSEAETTFKEVLVEDPSCSITAWGLASILMNNPLAGQGASPKGAEQAQAALDAARARPAKTERERDYIDAVAAYYRDFGKRTERERQLSRAAAYEKLAAKYPADDEAQIFHAVYLAGTQSLADPNYSAALKAAGILGEQFKKHPNHPGVAHYLIHSYDYPPIADKGVPAARLYAKIAPSAPHALHMPSHIFTRVGAWPDSVATNARSAEAAVKGNEPDEAWHASDYMVYASLQLARDARARKVWVDVQRVTNITPGRFTAFYARAAIPARIAVERGDWKEAAALPLQESKFPFTDALVRYARALGAARSGDPAAAEMEVQALRALHAQLMEAKNAYWATEVEVNGLTAQAWKALAQGNAGEAESRMRQAADIEDRSDKHIVTPGRILPARELLGDMLLEMKRPGDALKEYELSQKREPDRFRGLAGAAAAAQQSGDAAKARHYYARLVQIAGDGDPRPEIATAKVYLAKQ